MARLPGRSSTAFGRRWREGDGSGRQRPPTAGTPARVGHQPYPGPTLRVGLTIRGRHCQGQASASSSWRAGRRRPPRGRSSGGSGHESILGRERFPRRPHSPRRVAPVELRWLVVDQLASWRARRERRSRRWRGGGGPGRTAGHSIQRGWCSPQRKLTSQAAPKGGRRWSDSPRTSPTRAKTSYRGDGRGGDDSSLRGDMCSEGSTCTGNRVRCR